MKAVAFSYACVTGVTVALDLRTPHSDSAEFFSGKDMSAQVPLLTEATARGACPSATIAETPPAPKIIRAAPGCV